MASEDLLKKALAAFNALPPEQQAEMIEAQRQSWARGEAGLDRDGQTTVILPKPADNVQARLTAMSKTILRLRDVLLLIADNIDDEGDRYYFGSTNDADQLKDIAEELDGWHWDQIISDGKLPDVYENCRNAVARAKKAEADHAAKNAAYERLERQAIKDRKLRDEAQSDAVLWQFSVDMGEHPTLLVMVWKQRKALEAKLALAEQALTEIASFTQTTDLLWWQERARAVLGGKP